MRSLLGRMATRTPKTKPMQWRMTRTRTRTGRSARSRRGERPRARRTLVACSACWRRVDAHRLLPVAQPPLVRTAARRSTVLIARMTRPFGACAVARLRPFLLFASVAPLSAAYPSAAPCEAALGTRCCVRSMTRAWRARHSSRLSACARAHAVKPVSLACFLSLFELSQPNAVVFLAEVFGRHSPNPPNWAHCALHVLSTVV